MNWDEWTEESDFGMQNYLKVLESDAYELHYYVNEFSYRVPAQINCCDEWLSLGNFTNNALLWGARGNSAIPFRAGDAPIYLSSLRSLYMTQDVLCIVYCDGHGTKILKPPGRSG